jgi:hypothetical protein
VTARVGAFHGAGKLTLIANAAPTIFLKLLIAWENIPKA